MGLRSWSSDCQSPTFWNHWKHKSLLWFTLLILSLYINVTKNGFVWDDQTMIFALPSSQMALTASTNYVQGNTISHRPLMRLSFFLDHLVFGKNPAGFHLTNLLFHVAVILAFAMVSKSLLSASFASLLATTLFVLHPIHSEAAAALLGRSDLLVTLFSLLGLWAYRKRSLLLSMGLALLFALLAIASKESGVIVPLLYFWYDLCFRRKEGKRLWFRWLPFMGLMALAVVLYLRLVDRNLWHATPSQIWWGGSPYHTGLMMATVVVEYARLLFFPLRLSPWYVTPIVTSLLHWKVLAGIVVLIGFMISLIWTLSRYPAWSFGLGWMGIALLPVFNIIPIPGSMMAERWLYLPSVGFCFLGGLILDRFWTKILAPREVFMRIAVLAIVVVLALLMSWQTVRSNAVWRDDESLFRQVIARFPDSYKGHANLGKTLLEKGEVTEAKLHLQKAAGLKLDSPFPLNWLGETYLHEGKLDSARLSFHQAIFRDSAFSPAYLNLGELYYQIGKRDSALSIYSLGLKHFPSAELYNNIGLLWVEQGKLAAGVEAYQKALHFDSHYAPAYHNLGNAYRSQGDLPRAEGAYRQALKVDPQLAESHHALALIYESQGRWNVAIHELEEAVRERPGELGFQIALARAYVSIGDFKSALVEYDQILSKYPSLGAMKAERDSIWKRLSEGR